MGLWLKLDHPSRRHPIETQISRPAHTALAALIKYWDGYDIKRPDG